MLVKKKENYKNLITIIMSFIKTREHLQQSVLSGVPNYKTVGIVNM